MGSLHLTREAWGVLGCLALTGLTGVLSILLFMTMYRYQNRKIRQALTLLQDRSTGYQFSEEEKKLLGEGMAFIRDLWSHKKLPTHHWKSALADRVGRQALGLDAFGSCKVEPNDVNLTLFLEVDPAVWASLDYWTWVRSSGKGKFLLALYRGLGTY